MGRKLKLINPATRRVDYEKPPIWLYPNTPTEVAKDYAEMLLTYSPHVVSDQPLDEVLGDNQYDEKLLEEVAKINLEEVSIGYLRDLCVRLGIDKRSTRKSELYDEIMKKSDEILDAAEDK